MERRILRAKGLAAAPSATGAVVVIDVLRAFTTAAYAFAAGARDIVLVATPEEAFRLRSTRFPNAVLVGEIGGRPIAGFDHGNSPATVRSLDLAQATVILRTSSGTQGVCSAACADSIWLGSLVVASATARALAAELLVTLLATGSPHGPDGPEDEACADCLETLLRGGTPDHAKIARTVRTSPAGRLALDPAIDFITPEDLECALAIDRFDFAMKVERRGQLRFAYPESV